MLSRLGVTALFGAFVAHMAACGGPASEGGVGVACFRASECQAGLVCVDRVCTNDLTSIDIHPEGGAGAGGTGAGGTVDDGGSGGAQGGAGGASGGAGGAAGPGGSAPGGSGPGGGAPGGSGPGPDDASTE